MFGIVPKSIWGKLNSPDDKNLCTWAMRCLLVETGGRNILIDTGMGDKQDARFRKHFEPHGEASLMDSLRKKGFAPEDITDVFLTHLHFDHCGGAVKMDENGKLVPAFPKATYWSNERHYAWAMRPNAREKASFLQENFVPLQEAGAFSNSFCGVVYVVIFPLVSTIGSLSSDAGLVSEGKFDILTIFILHIFIIH